MTLPGLTACNRVVSERRENAEIGELSASLRPTLSLLSLQSPLLPVLSSSSPFPSPRPPVPESVGRGRGDRESSQSGLSARRSCGCCWGGAPAKGPPRVSPTSRRGQSSPSLSLPLEGAGQEDPPNSSSATPATPLGPCPWRKWSAPLGDHHFFSGPLCGARTRLLLPGGAFRGWFARRSVWLPPAHLGRR